MQVLSMYLCMNVRMYACMSFCLLCTISDESLAWLKLAEFPSLVHPKPSLV